jgi:hypothetical protein
MNFSGCSIIMHSTSPSSVAITSPKYSYPYIETFKNIITYCIFEEITITKDITPLDRGYKILVLRINNIAFAVKNNGNRCLGWIFELFLSHFWLLPISEVSSRTATHSSINLFLRSTRVTSVIAH